MSEPRLSEQMRLDGDDREPSMGAPAFADAVAALEEQLQAARAALTQFRFRVFGLYRAKGFDHTTACTIWGDNGQGGTKENFQEPLPCNCGALLNWKKKQIAVLEECIRCMREATSPDPLTLEDEFSGPEIKASAVTPDIPGREGI